MFAGMPVGLILLFAAVAIVFLGWGQRVLDRMRLTDTQALILLGLMIAGSFFPGITLAPGFSVDVGGALVPIGVAVYLISTAGTSMERTRAVLTSVLAAAIVYALDRLLPAEPGIVLPVDLDPLYLPAVVGGIVAYLGAGRSRRSAFIAGTAAVIGADLAVAVENLIRGVPGAFVAIGGAGVFDASIVSGFLAVALAEVIGETREYLQGGPSQDRPEALLEGLSQERRAESGKGAALPPEEAVQRPAGGGERFVPDAREPESGTPGRAGSALMLLASALLLTAGGLIGPMAGPGDEVIAGDHFRLRDTEGRLIMESGRRIHVGDDYISGDNHWYRVREVEERLAVAEDLGMIRLEQDLPLAAEAAVPAGLFELFGGDRRENAEPDRGRSGRPGEGAAAGRRDVTIGIFTTHNDESYITASGAANVNGRGDIHKVAGALEEALKKKGYKVLHDESVHLPHDRGAYRRSRRTAWELVQQGADLLIDVHRDAGPGESYAKVKDGKGYTQIRMVVGRQNPQQAATMQFAQRLKAIADEMEPGLVKGIFRGRGNYNQDLGPHVILIEVGTEKNALQSAERGVTRFADVVDQYIQQNMIGQTGS